MRPPKSFGHLTTSNTALTLLPVVRACLISSRVFRQLSNMSMERLWPKDRRQAEGLVQLHHEMEVGYSRLVTISTDNMLLTNEYRDGVGAHWTFLSDPGRKVQKDLDIAEYTDPEHNPMIPHVIVLEH